VLTVIRAAQEALLKCPTWNAQRAHWTWQCSQLVPDNGIFRINLHSLKITM